MTEPRFVPVDEIKSMKGAIRPTDNYLTLPRADVEALLNTAEQQAERIKRLQAAVKELSREMEGYRPHEVAWVELTHDGILKFEDMEDTDE